MSFHREKAEELLAFPPERDFTPALVHAVLALVECLEDLPVVGISVEVDE